MRVMKEKAAANRRRICGRGVPLNDERLSRRILEAAAHRVNRPARLRRTRWHAKRALDALRTKC